MSADSVATVWKFQDFPVIQILHEIDFGNSRYIEVKHENLLLVLLIICLWFSVSL